MKKLILMFLLLICCASCSNNKKDNYENPWALIYVDHDENNELLLYGEIGRKNELTNINDVRNKIKENSLCNLYYYDDTSTFNSIERYLDKTTKISGNVLFKNQDGDKIEYDDLKSGDVFLAKFCKPQDYSLPMKIYTNDITYVGHVEPFGFSNTIFPILN